MTAPLVLALLLGPVAAAPVYVLDLTERSEARVRSPGDALDLEQTAGAHLELRMPRTRIGFGYAPRLSLTDVTSNAQVDLLHTGAITADFMFQKATLSLGEHVSYGTRSFTALQTSTQTPAAGDGTTPGAPTTPAPTTPGTSGMQPATPTTAGVGTTLVPIVANISYASSDTSAALTLVLSRRWQLVIGGGYLLDGGIEQDDRVIIPWVYGPRANVEVQYQLTRNDVLGTGVEAESYHTDTGTSGPLLRADIVRASERWGHRFSSRTSSELSGGGAFVRRAPTDDTDLLPIGSASLRHVVPTGAKRELVTFDGSAKVDMLVDRLSGLPDHRFDLAIGVTWTRDPYQLFGAIGRTQSLRSSSTANTLALYSGEFGGRYQLSRPVQLELGYRSAYQSVDDPTSRAAAASDVGFNWLLFFAITVTADSIEF